MNKIIKILLLLLLTGFLNSCSEDDPATSPLTYRTLVLLSDYDDNSDFIIQLKGTVNNQHPDVKIDFVKIKSFNVPEGGYLLSAAAEKYGDGTYFVGIVEPGSNNKKMVFKSEGNKKFLLPDNGLGTRVFDNLTCSDYYFIESEAVLGEGGFDKIGFEQFYEKSVVALLNDTDLNIFGSSVEDAVRLNVVDAQLDGSVIKGQILFMNNFGNGITNINSELLADISYGDILEISVGDKKIFAEYAATFGDVSYQHNLIRINSSNKLEIAVNMGNAEERYSLRSGMLVNIQPAVLNIGILKYNDSPVVLEIVSGLKTQLSELGFNEGAKVNFIERSAEGDFANLSGLTTEILSANTDIFVAVSTPAAQAAVQLVPEDIPLIYTYITDPASAGLLNKRSNMTGLSDATNFNDFMTFVRRLIPDIKKAGTIYNPDESNSDFANAELNKIANFTGIELLSSEVNSAADCPVAFANLTDAGVESILVVADNTVSGAMSELAPTAWSDGSNMPLIGDSFMHCKDGALASVSVDYKEMAKSTGDYISDVIFGIRADDIPMKKFPTSIIAVNKTTADKIGFEISADILEEAVYIYE